MASCIEVSGASFSYIAAEGQEPVKVFENLNLTVEQGSYTVILGHNGCGKSTLAKHLNAILLPAGGKIYVYGMDTADEAHLIDVRRNVGMVFQNPDNQIVSNIVEEDVAFALENLGLPSNEIRERVDLALKAVGMYEYRNHAPNLLSGGQKQRVAIAGVLAMRPQCVVLDEPTAMLDPRGRQDVIDTVRRLNQEKGITIVLITHHMDEAAKADRVVVLDKGTVAADGAPREVFSRVDLLHQIGLAAPDSVELCRELNRRGMDLPLDVLEPEECARLLYERLCRGKTEGKEQ